MWKLYLFILVAVAWGGVYGFGSLSILEWSNASFITGMIFILITAISSILKSGFLTPFFSGFQLISEKMLRKSRAMERTDRMAEKDPELKEFKYNAFLIISQVAFVVGTSSLMMSGIGLFLFYS